VSLFIVDELHLIGGLQGPVMEVVVSRMRFIASQTEKPMRVLGLSASVANARDLGQWIGATAASIFNFHPNVRPVPLEIRVQGFDIASFHAMQLAMVKPCYLNIKKARSRRYRCHGARLTRARAQHSPNKPVIVFVESQRQARHLAVDLVTFAAADDQSVRYLNCDEAVRAQRGRVGRLRLADMHRVASAGLEAAPRPH
jgi:pre-mRNA-splicing helicase BRR2